MHPWDIIRQQPRIVDAATPIHQSCYQADHILQQVTTMLDRGDSPQTIRDFIAWAQTPTRHQP